MTIGERIKARRIELGLSVDELAARLGKNRATIYRYESGAIKDMPTPVLEPLAKALNTTPAELMGWGVDAEKFWNFAQDFNARHPELSAPTSSCVRIPVLRRVAAGIPLDSIEEVIDWEELPAHVAQKGSFFGLRIKGDSMEPGIRDGDTVIVREQEDAENGEIVVALVNGNDGCCKRLKKYDNGTIALISDNVSYPPMYFNNSEIDNIPVVIRGVVKELRRKL